MELLTGKTLEQTLKNFNKESWRVNALNYNQFLNSKFSNGKSIMDVLYELQKVVKYSPNKYVNKRLSNETNINLVLEFYEKLDLREKVEPIIMNTHPMFNTIIDKNSESQVCHKGIDSKITFSVGDTGTFDGIINLAHECAHAINGHYQQMQNFLKEQNEIFEQFGKDSKEFNEFIPKFNNYLKEQASFMHDCITETESRIIEMLLLEFLIDKNTISPEDKQLYLNQRNNSFRNDLQLMFQEDLIYSTIIKIKQSKNCHIADLNEEEYNEMSDQLKRNSHFKEIMVRFDFIANREKLNKKQWHSSYRFRYVVGEIISTVWIDKYKSFNKSEKQKMIENLKTFIANNHNCNLDKAIQLLLNGETYETIINRFVEINNIHSLEQ